jgi:pimeloyl-ACP methyl ester carboxylesterase
VQLLTEFGHGEDKKSLLVNCTRVKQIYLVDTHGELSAFEPISLYDQASFAAEAIDYILRLYDSPAAPENLKPKNVLVIGHSMGGIVARLIPLLSNYRPNSIKDIITLATPHREAPLPIHYDMVRLYSFINEAWHRYHGSPNHVLSDITLVSVAGGSRDKMVDSEMTNIDFANPKSSLHIHMTGTPGLWSSGDHEASTWCDQLLQKLANLAFDIFQLHGTASDRIELIRKDFRLEKWQGSMYFLKKSTDPSQAFQADKIFRVGRVHTLSTNRLQLDSFTLGKDEDRSMYLPLPVNSSEHSSYIFRLISNVPNDSLKVYGCKLEYQEFVCKNLNKELELLPHKYSKSEFSIKWWKFETPESFKRPEILKYDLPMQAENQYSGLLFELSPGSRGYLFAEVVLKSAGIKIYDTWKASMLQLI